MRRAMLKKINNYNAGSYAALPTPHSCACVGGKEKKMLLRIRF